VRFGRGFVTQKKFHNDLLVQISSGKYPLVYAAIITKILIQHVSLPPEDANEIIKN
jgi:hypothetical protein